MDHERAFVKDSVSILLCVPLPRGGWVSRTVSVYCYAGHYRGVDGCQGQYQYIVMRATTEGWMGVKDSVSILLCVPLPRGGWVSRTVSVYCYACHYRGVDGCQGQCQYIVMRATTEGWMGVKDSVSILLCVPLQRGGWVSRTVSVYCYACHYRGVDGCQGQREHIVMRATTEGWMGVKECHCVTVMRATTGGGGGGSRTVSVCGYACCYRGVDGCQRQCACHDGGWVGVVGGGCQRQCRYVVMCATTEGWMGVKDSLSSTVSCVSL